LDFRYTPEQEQFRREVRAFIDAEATEEVRQNDVGGLMTTPARRAFVKKLAAKGWIAFSWPEEYGGNGLDPMYGFILNEELAYAGAPRPGTAAGTIGMTILHHAGEELKQDLLPRILRGEIEWAIGYTEPEAGSDLANLQLRAVRDGDDYVINGQKRFTTAAHFADYMWLAARTNFEVPKHRGISLFAIPMGRPGMTVVPMYKMGMERVNEVFYDNVRVPAAWRVGEENRGWYYIAEALDYERFAITTPAPTVRSFDRLVAWARDARLGERRPAKEARARHRLARLAIEVEITKMLQLRAAAVAQKGAVPNVESAMLKLHSSQLGGWIANNAVDLMGPYGQLLPDTPSAPAVSYARGLQTSVIATVAGGSTEVTKTVIARRLLGLPGA
jgi:alkylation response protein AidB-like acyl-CoA dehydrogenase